MSRTLAQRRLLANLVPRAEKRTLVDQHFHDEVDDKPRGKNENEAHTNVPKYLFCLARLARLTACCNVFQSRPSEEYGGEKDRDVDACVQDVLRKLRDIAKGAWMAPRRTGAGHDGRYLRERNRGRNGK